MQKSSRNLSLQCIKRIINHNQVGFIPNIQGWLNIRIPANVKHNMNRLKNKTHMSISVNAETVLSKNLTPIHNFRKNSANQEQRVPSSIARKKYLQEKEKEGK
jgi:hypothetical protein